MNRGDYYFIRIDAALKFIVTVEAILVARIIKADRCVHGKKMDRRSKLFKSRISHDRCLIKSVELRFASRHKRDETREKGRGVRDACSSREIDNREAACVSACARRDWPRHLNRIRARTEGNAARCGKFK